MRKPSVDMGGQPGPFPLLVGHCPQQPRLGGGRKRPERGDSSSKNVGQGDRALHCTVRPNERQSFHVATRLGCCIPYTWASSENMLRSRGVGGGQQSPAMCTVSCLCLALKLARISPHCSTPVALGTVSVLHTWFLICRNPLLQKCCGECVLCIMYSFP